MSETFPDDVVFDQEALSEKQLAVRAKLAQGICPECGKGPYQMVASHVVRMHDIDGVTLRRMAGYNHKDASIADPEHIQRQSEKGRARYEAMTPSQQQAWIRAGQAHQSEIDRSLVSRRVQANKSRDERSRAGRLGAAGLHASSTPEERKAWSRAAIQAISHEGRVRAGKAGGAARVSKLTPEQIRDHMLKMRAKQGREIQSAAGKASAAKQLQARKAGKETDQYRLSAQKVLAIRSDYAAGGITQAELGVRFGVSPSLISMIVNKKIWAWVSDNPESAHENDTEHHA